MLCQHITACSSAITFTRPIPGNVCVQAEGMKIFYRKPMKTLVLIQTMSKVSHKKIKLSYQIVSPYYLEKITLK